MEITREETVTRVYCDVCNKDITHGSRRGPGTDHIDEGWVTCMSTKWSLETNAKIGVQLACDHLAIFYTRYPELANEHWIHARSMDSTDYE